MKTVIIVGGGYGGIALAKDLEKQILSKLGAQQARVLLIDTKSHFYHSVGGLRAGVQDLDNRIFIPYTNLFKNPVNQVIHATVTHFDSHAVFLNSAVADFGGEIKFDFLVIASGIQYPAPARVELPGLEEGQQQIQQVRQQIGRAHHILIVGGGPCGIELAGEIRDEYPEKRLTMIHSQPQLGNASYIPLHYHRQLLQLLKSNHVNILLNDRAILPAQRQHQTAFVPTHPLPATRNGEDLADVDFVFLAASSKPNVDWVQTSFPDLVAENGFVKVKSSLQVDHPTLANSVFVIGDVAALQETKMAYRAAKSHAPIAAANIIRLLQEPDASYDSLKKYKKGADMMLITFGKDKGAALLPWGILAGNWISSRLKSKTLMIDRMWKELNQQAPRVDPHRSSSIFSSTSSVPRYTVILAAISSFSAILYHYYKFD